MMNLNRIPKLFISYAHEDKPLKDELVKFMDPLKEKRQIELWDDLEIVPGQEWEKAILEELAVADIIVLLVSADFLASEFIKRNELKTALMRHEQSTAVIIPVILRQVDWPDTPLSKIQALPNGAVPVTQWPDRDTAWFNVVDGIKKVLDTMNIDQTIVQPTTKSKFTFKILVEQHTKCEDCVYINLNIRKHQNVTESLAKIDCLINFSDQKYRTPRDDYLFSFGITECLLELSAKDCTFDDKAEFRFKYKFQNKTDYEGILIEPKGTNTNAKWEFKLIQENDNTIKKLAFKDDKLTLVNNINTSAEIDARLRVDDLHHIKIFVDDNRLNTLERIKFAVIKQKLRRKVHDEFFSTDAYRKVIKIDNIEST